MQQDLATERLIHAEQAGLRLAILCRTIAVGAGVVWLLGAYTAVGHGTNPWGISALALFFLIGIAHLKVIGTRFERWWMKYAIYTLDILGIAALFAFMPISVAEEVPQIIAFRAYGIYYFFPLIAMACLCLSWHLVLWCGLVAAAGWWVAFLIAISGMERQLSWGDLPAPPDLAGYQEIFLSMDFVGLGNRVEESGALLIASAVLALAVYRARAVFFAQVEAEATRDKVAATLGRYVPESIARKLVANSDALRPQERHGVALVMDVANFSRFAASRPPQEVISVLNDFLASAADAVAERGGVVISFTGDGLLATFNTPIEIEGPETAALDAAQDLVQIAGSHGFGIRVGLAAGPMAAGSIGSARRQAFTVYGDTVNRAARLEALGKTLGQSIIADAAVAERTERNLDPQGTHDLRGLAGSTEVFALQAAA